MIGFTGTRAGMTPAQKTAVREILSRTEIALTENSVGHGDCVGADAEFDEIAKELEYQRNIYPSDIESMRAHCELRGAIQVSEPEKPLIRNSRIVNDSSMIIATPKESTEVLRSGTWATIRRARKAGCELYLVLPNGEIRS